jgi:hypothetical protein
VADAPASDVFVSFDLGDREFADAVQESLRDAGYRVAATPHAEPGKLDRFRAVVVLVGAHITDVQLGEIIAIYRAGDAVSIAVLLPGGQQPLGEIRRDRVVDVRDIPAQPLAVRRIVEEVREATEPPSPLSLRPTVASIPQRLPGLVPAAAIIRDLFSVRPSYADGRGKSVRVDEREGDVRKPADVWLSDIRSLLDEDRAPVLTSRLVIAGLFLLEPSLRERIRPPDAFEALVDEISPPFADLLTPRGRELWHPNLEPDERREESVLFHTDNAATVDALRRDGFARVLAGRIRAMRAQEARAARQEAEAAKRKAQRAGGRAAPPTWKARITSWRDRRRRTEGRAFLVHVDGPWGSGKTSLLNFLEDHLRVRATEPRGAEHRPWVVVKFNAWQHQRIVPPWWWLMNRVAQDGGEAVKHISRSSWLWFRVRELAWLASPAVPWLVIALVVGAIAGVFWWLGAMDERDEALAWVTIGATIAGAVVATSGILRSFTKAVSARSAQGARAYLEQTRDPMEAAKAHFASLVAWLRYPVVIFVDDLDRCKGSTVVELLEGIQTLFRDVPVTFVVAADRDWLADSYEAEYRAFESLAGEPGRPFGYVFLEKTFQLSVKVPGVPTDARETFWRDLLRPAAQDGVTELDEARERADNEMRDMPAEEAMRVIAANPGSDAADQLARAETVALKQASPEQQKELEHALKPFDTLLEENPRALKRLVNAFGVARDLEILDLRNLTRDQREQQQTALWVILGLRWPQLADYLAEHPGAVESIRSRPVSVSMPSKLRPLFDDPRVRKVIDGDARDVHARLDSEAIARLARRG